MRKIELGELRPVFWRGPETNATNAFGYGGSGSVGNHMGTELNGQWRVAPGRQLRNCWDEIRGCKTCHRTAKWRSPSTCMAAEDARNFCELALRKSLRIK
jgi:hypothetical protein